MVSVAADLDSVPNRLLFGLNGEWAAPMGVAFEGISFENHIFPALTADEGTSVRVNFGSTGFAFGPPDQSFRSWASHRVAR